MEWLDSNIVNFSKIFPSYWFIQGNYNITKLAVFDFETLKPIIQNFGVVVLFGIVFFVIGKVIVSRSRI